MKCPHCRVEIHSNPSLILVGTDRVGGWVLQRENCPACGKLSLKLQMGDAMAAPGGQFVGIHGVRVESLVHPRGALRPPCPTAVPAALADDYNEACLVLPESPKASAALSRRCLQHLLREAAKVKPGNLANEIQEVIESGKLPTYLAESIDAVRHTGNFGAHPMKSQHT